MKSPTILVSAISIESRWKIIGEAPNYACAGETAIGGWGVGTIRKDKVCIDHRRLGKVCTVQTLHLRLPPQSSAVGLVGLVAVVSIDHRRVGLRGPNTVAPLNVFTPVSIDHRRVGLRGAPSHNFRAESLLQPVLRA